LVLAIALIGFVGFKAYSERLGPLVQAHGTTFYNGEGLATGPVPCKPESDILTAIGQVHAKYDHLSGDGLAGFWRRAAELKGLPPMDVDGLYVITEDEQFRKGEMVLFIGIKGECVSTVFSFPTRLYLELLGSAGRA
jgi:hypothetical protein